MNPQRKVRIERKSEKTKYEPEEQKHAMINGEKSGRTNQKKYKWVSDSLEAGETNPGTKVLKTVPGEFKEWVTHENQARKAREENNLCGTESCNLF